MQDKKIGKKIFGKVVYYVAAVVVILLLVVLCRFSAQIDRRVKQWKRSKKPFIMLSGHPSEMDAAVLVAVCFPRMPRIVAGERQLYRKGGLGALFRTVGCIPKKQFLPDMHAIREMLAAVKRGELLAMMPEGRVSFDGTASPIDYSTAKLVKKLKLPVAVLMPQGTYFMMPPYHNTGLTFGKIGASVRVLLDEGEAETLTTDEIYGRIVEALQYDQSVLVRDNGWHYGKRRHPMQNVTALMYRCPKCGAHCSMEDDGNGNIRCTACGLQLTADSNMQFHAETDDVPANVTEWNAFQKNEERKKYADENAEFRATAERAVLVQITDSDYEPRGEGEVRLNKDGLYYSDADETLEIPLAQLTGASADYRKGTVIIYREDATRRFTFDHATGTAEFMNSLMVLRELYIS